MPGTTSVTDLARDYVVDYLNKEAANLGQDMSVLRSDTYAVWSCYILGHWKCLVSTDFPDTRYYEVTFDSKKNAIYLDVYTKVINVRIDVDEPGADG